MNNPGDCEDTYLDPSLAWDCYVKEKEQTEGTETQRDHGPTFPGKMTQSWEWIQEWY